MKHSHLLAALLFGIAPLAQAGPLALDLSFGNKSGPAAGVLSSTSLADILTGQGEGLFSAQNLQFAAFNGPLGHGNVTGVGAIGRHRDVFCVDACRDISGDLFSGGQRSGSYVLEWFFNDTVLPGSEFPIGSGSPRLKDVNEHPGYLGDPDYPGFSASYTPRSQFTDLYGAMLRSYDLSGNMLFSALFASSDCAVPSQCSAFSVQHNYTINTPIDRLNLHFEGPVFRTPEPAALALVALALGCAGLRRRR